MEDSRKAPCILGRGIPGVGVVLRHLGKLGPGGEVIILLHSDKGHIGVALRVWQERVFTRVLAVVQNLSFTAAGSGGERPRQGLPHECVTQALCF